MTQTIAIIGGGITGLSAAFYLQREAQARGRDLACTVLEADHRVGGKIVTEREESFVIEGGPDSFITEKPWGLTLCRDLGLEHELIPANEQQKTVYVLRHGKIVPFPAGFRLTVPTEVWPFLVSPLFTLRGKLRMGWEYMVPPRREAGDETLADFIRRRLGEEALDRIAGPLLAGIFVSDPERLSMQSTFPRLMAMERDYGSLIRGARVLKKKAARPGGPPSASTALFNSLKPGMGHLVDVLEQRLGPVLHRQARVAAVQRTEHGFRMGLADGRQLEADQVLITAPAFAAANMVSGMHPHLAHQLRQIRFVSTATVSCAYLAEDIPPGRALDGYGVLIPASEPSRILAATWSSTKFRHRAPADAVLLRAFVGGYRDEAAAALPDSELLNAVTTEFHHLFGVTRPPMLHRIFRWPRANPQYDVGHLDRVADIEKSAAEIPGLHLAGSSYRGVGMPDCIHSAHQAVKRILG
jgi:oxygen-dependent protoporphyrinogen oxidase